MEMERVSPMRILVFIAALLAAASSSSSSADDSKATFADMFEMACPDDHFKTSEDGQIWHLSLDKDAGTYLKANGYSSRFPIKDLFLYHNK